MNFKYLLFSLFNTGLIIYVSSIPDRSFWGNGSMSEQVISNLGHIPAYGLLTFLWLKAFDRRKSKSRFFKVNALIFISLLLFAVSDEIHQSFVPGRSPSCIDVGLNITGILFGLGIFSAKGRFDFLPFMRKGGNKKHSKSLANPV